MAWAWAVCIRSGCCQVGRRVVFFRIITAMDHGWVCGLSNEEREAREALSLIGKLGGVAVG